MVTNSEDFTTSCVIEAMALELPAGMSTAFGKVTTFVLLLVSNTFAPPGPATPLSVTVAKTVVSELPTNLVKLKEMPERLAG
jgi:hypothetical protein